MQRAAQGRVWWPLYPSQRTRQSQDASDVRHCCLVCRSVAQDYWLLIIKEQNSLRGAVRPKLEKRRHRLLHTGIFSQNSLELVWLYSVRLRSRLLQEAQEKSNFKLILN